VKKAREVLPLLETETEVVEGISMNEITPALIVSLPLFLVKPSMGLVAGITSLIVFSQLKKKLGSSEKVYEFIRYVGRPQYYRRKP